MIRLAGLFVLVVVIATWVLFASSILDAIGNGGRATVLETVAPTETVPPRPTATAPPADGSATPGATTDAATATPAATDGPVATPTTTTGPDGQRTYTIEQGDNLTRIANRFDVTLQALQEANGITDPSSIKVGQVLIIPPSE